jgi:hypothetical protein
MQKKPSSHKPTKAKKPTKQGVKSNVQQAHQSFSSSQPQPTQHCPPKTWIEIVLVDEKGHPVPGVHYSIHVPGSQSPHEGTLDEQGLARVDGIDPGTCKVTFPELDKDFWEAA